MTTNINFINGDGSGYSEPRELRDGVTISEFFNAIFPGANPRAYLVRINDRVVGPQQVLREGDTVSIIRSPTAPAAATPGVFATPSAPVAGVNIRFIDNGAGGVAENTSVPQNTKLGDFLVGRRVDADEVVIRVNGDIAVRDYILRPNDVVVVAPSKIEGAANIRVSLVCNDGTGFADYVDVPEGTTLGNLVAAKTNLGNPKDYVISLNGIQVPLDQRVLSEGARISITPNKIQGA